jgi:hypothetical protein
MDQALEHWVGLWDYLDGNFWGFCSWSESHLGPDQVGWQPVPEVASIGWNLWHLAEMLDHYLAHAFGRGPQFRAGSLSTMRSGSRDDGRFRDLGAVTDYHRLARPAYRAFLAGLSAADLDRPLGGTGRTWGWAVGHIAEHESYHLGKCMLLRNLLPRRR